MGPDSPGSTPNTSISTTMKSWPYWCAFLKPVDSVAYILDASTSNTPAHVLVLYDYEGSFAVQTTGSRAQVVVKSPVVSTTGKTTQAANPHGVGDLRLEVCITLQYSNACLTIIFPTCKNIRYCNMQECHPERTCTSQFDCGSRENCGLSRTLLRLWPWLPSQTQTSYLIIRVERGWLWPSESG